jgi:hypothetical protein
MAESYQFETGCQEELSFLETGRSYHQILSRGGSLFCKVELAARRLTG